MKKCFYVLIGKKQIKGGYDYTHYGYTCNKQRAINTAKYVKQQFNAEVMVFCLSLCDKF